MKPSSCVYKVTLQPTINLQNLRIISKYMYYINLNTDVTYISDLSKTFFSRAISHNCVGLVHKLVKVYLTELNGQLAIT